MKQISKKDLTSGSVQKHLLKLTFPMLGGFLAMTIFNLTDTYFVSRLGTDYLAAMGFTMPIVMFVASIAMGMGVSVASIVSRKIGRKDIEGVRHFMFDSLLFVVIFVLVISIAGRFLLKYLLTAMGAEGAVHGYAASYMNIWFTFVAVMFIPMVSNNAIRATGHAMIPALVMALGAVLNILLDWLLIFGNWGFPALGIEGAAWATVLSRLTGIFLSVALLRWKFGILSFERPRLERFIFSIRELLITAVPATANSVMMPLSNMVLVGMVANYGNTAVAAFNAGNQILRFSFMLPMAMGTALMPIAGQNWGGGQIDRIKDAWRFGNIFSLIYAALSWLCLLWLGKYLAGAFSNNGEVIEQIILYLNITVFTSGFLHIAVHSGFVFNAVERPHYATVLCVLRFFILTVPLAWIGMESFGLKGIFGGVAIANLACGLVALAWLKTFFNRQSRKDFDEAFISASVSGETEYVDL
jgi:putative MATE family efflux protein